MDNLATKAELYSELRARLQRQRPGIAARREAMEQIERLYVERDIARRMYCRLAALHDRTGVNGHLDSSELLGWNCFTEERKA